MNFSTEILNSFLNKHAQLKPSKRPVSFKRPSYFSSYRTRAICLGGWDLVLKGLVSMTMEIKLNPERYSLLFVLICLPIDKLEDRYIVMVEPWQPSCKLQPPGTITLICKNN